MFPYCYEEHEPPFTCKYCGRPSWIDPSEQLPPPDYCHPSDHGTVEDWHEYYASDYGTEEDWHEY